MSNISRRDISTNGITMHIAEAGEGPAVVMLHGFPESWYSYRHQIAALAEAGYHAIAPDQRGYGGTDRPDDPAQYSQLHLVGDVIGLLDAIGVQEAVVVGHDWGAPVAWNAALMRPDRIRGVVGLSVPYIPRGPMSMLQAMRSMLGDGFYMQYFQEPGVADAELARDVRTTVIKMLYGASGDVPETGLEPVVPEGMGLLDLVPEPPSLPAWLTEEDIDFFTAEFERTGFTGGLNWYRAIELSWELTAPWAGSPITVPALYVAGDRDLVYAFPAMRDLIPVLSTFIPNLRETIILPGCGHWTQQERPDDVNEALIKFLAGL